MRYEMNFYIYFRLIFVFICLSPNFFPNIIGTHIGISHSVQNLLSSMLLSKNLKIKIYRTIILPVVSYGCETWSLTLREERKLRGV